MEMNCGRRGKQCARTILLCLVCFVIGSNLLWVLLFRADENKDGDYYSLEESSSVLKKSKHHEYAGDAYASFPRWKDPASLGISPTTFLNVVKAYLDDVATMTDHSKKNESLSGRRHKVYIIDTSSTLWKAQWPLLPEAELRRAAIMEKLAIRALHQVVVAISMESAVFSSAPPTTTRTGAAAAAVHLRHAIQHSGGLIYMVNYEDSTWCCSDIAMHNMSPIPIFSLSAPLHHCDYAFPIPTYATIQDARHYSRRLHGPVFRSNKWWIQRWWNHWQWSHQKPQAIWRGSPTGHPDATQNVRKRLCALAQQHPTLLDAKLVGQPRWPSSNIINDTHLYGDWMHQRDFANYRAVIDMDGNAWSSRFGALLCSSSVVIKIAPVTVDYFYPELQPWQHYVPVHGNLSNVVEMVQYAISDQHQDEMQRIKHNAHQWCLAKMNHFILMQDMIGIWDDYARLFHLGADKSNNRTIHESKDVVSWQDGLQTLLAEYDFSIVA